MNINNIQTIIDSYAQSLSGKFGVFFKDLNTGVSCGTNINEVFPTASMAKVYILAELYKLAYEGKIDLDQRLEFKASNKSAGSGVLSELTPGFSLTIRDYALLMMNISDNAAADICYHLTGSGNIEKDILIPFKLEKTQINMDFRTMLNVYCGVPEDTEPDDFQSAIDKKYKDEPSFTLRNYRPYIETLEHDDVTSPKDLGSFFEILYKGQWVNEDVSEQIIDVMKKCQTNSRIPKLLPPGVAVTHKTGSMDKLANDGGIVYTRKGDYILIMMYNANTADEAEYKNNKKGSYSDSALANMSLEIFKEYIH